MSRRSPHIIKVPERCASCGVSRNAGDRCDYCGAIYTDGFHIGLHDTYGSSLNEKYKIKQDGRDIEITWRWRKPIHWALFAFSLFWCFITITAIFSILTFEDHLRPFEVLPIPLTHLFIGILGASFAAVYFFNNTTIKANFQSMCLAHHPISWRGGVKFDASDVADIVVERKRRSRKKHNWDVPVLHVVTTSGLRHALLEGQSEEEFRDYEALRRYLLVALDLEYD